MEKRPLFRLPSCVRVFRFAGWSMRRTFLWCRQTFMERSVRRPTNGETPIVHPTDFIGASHLCIPQCRWHRLRFVRRINRCVCPPKRAKRRDAIRPYRVLPSSHPTTRTKPSKNPVKPSSSYSNAMLLDHTQHNPKPGKTQ